MLMVSVVEAKFERDGARGIKKPAWRLKLACGHNKVVRAKSLSMPAPTLAKCQQCVASMVSTCSRCKGTGKRSDTSCDECAGTGRTGAGEI